MFDKNLFYGGNSAEYPEDNNKITADPCFVSPGKAELGIDTLDGYKLSQNSLCIDRGKLIADNGGKDYFGTEITDGIPDIGAAEYTSEKPMYTEIYNNTKKFTLSYISNSEHIESIPPNAEVLVKGSL